jgi:hypothetical protein
LKINTLDETMVRCKTSVERAFELAATGKYLSIHEIGRQLTREDFRADVIEGPILRRQLMKIFKAMPTVAAARQCADD